jgi:hypothetical protein
MSLPSPDQPCWQKLATGGISRIKTQQLSIQLMAKRLERSTDTVTAKAAEVYSFFVKWERSLTSEIQQLLKL